MGDVGAEKASGGAMTAYEKLKELQITFPVAEAADAAFSPPCEPGICRSFRAHRKAGSETLGGEIERSHLTTAAGKLAARRAAINPLATLCQELQDLGIR
jgi:hypothetical protein